MPLGRSKRVRRNLRWIDTST